MRPRPTGAAGAARSSAGMPVSEPGGRPAGVVATRRTAPSRASASSTGVRAASSAVGAPPRGGCAAPSGMMSTSAGRPDPRSEIALGITPRLTARCARSPLDPLLRADARVHRVLDLDDLGDEVGGLDEARVGVAAGGDDVLEARALRDRLDHFAGVDPAPLDGGRDLVEEQELEALLGDRPLDLVPPLAREVGGLLEVTRDPRPAVAHLLPGDAAERRGRLRLADLPLAGLDELEDAAAMPPRPRAQQHPEGRRALALAVTGDHDHQRPVARLAPLGLGAALVARAVRDVDGAHAALLGVMGTRKTRGRWRAAAFSDSAWTWPPPAAASAAASPRRTGPSSVSITCSASAAAPRRAAAARALPSGSATRPSVMTMASARRSGSRSASPRMSDSAAASPAASGVRPPVGSSWTTWAARSSGAPGATFACAPPSRKARMATRSRRA